MFFYTTSLFMSISVDINNQFDIYIYRDAFFIALSDSMIRKNAICRKNDEKNPWEGIPLDKTKNFGTWKISTLKNIYRKYLARYPSIIYLHVFLLQYIHSTSLNV
jgi:hypothetical protein